MSDEPISTMELDAEELKQLETGDEAAILTLCTREFERSLCGNDAFGDWVADLDPMICRRRELVDAIRQAPNAIQRQHLFAIYQFRQTINLISGRGFS